MAHLQLQLQEIPEHGGMVRSEGVTAHIRHPVAEPGGSYTEISGRIKKLLPHEKLLIMDIGTRIPVEDIVAASVRTL